MAGAPSNFSSATPAVVHRPSPDRKIEQRAGVWLALAVVALPWLARLQLDFERCAPLILLSPALWTGRSVLARGLARFSSLSSLWTWLAVVLFFAAVVAV